jgi:hypothetical protein
MRVSLILNRRIASHKVDSRPGQICGYSTNAMRPSQSDLTAENQGLGASSSVNVTTDNTDGPPPWLTSAPLFYGDGGEAEAPIWRLKGILESTRSRGRLRRSHGRSTYRHLGHISQASIGECCHGRNVPMMDMFWSLVFRITVGDRVKDERENGARPGREIGR